MKLNKRCFWPLWVDRFRFALKALPELAFIYFIEELPSQVPLYALFAKRVWTLVTANHFPAVGAPPDNQLVLLHGEHRALKNPLQSRSKGKIVCMYCNGWVVKVGMHWTTWNWPYLIPTIRQGFWLFNAAVIFLTIHYDLFKIICCSRHR